MAGKPKSKSQSYSGSSNPAFLPFAKDAIGHVNADYKAAQPVSKEAIAGTQTLSGQLGGTFQGGLANQGQAQGHWGDVMSGKYMQGNPYLEQMIAASRGGISNEVNSRAALSGRYGSDMHYGALTRELAAAENQLRFNDYNMQTGRMDQAAQDSYGANSATAQQQLASLGLMGELPYTGMQAYGNSLGAIFNGGSSKSSEKGVSPIWQAIGNASSAAASAGAAGSDRRLKKDIVELGIRPDGLTAFEWTYRFDPEQARYRGVMADEVKIKRPEAYIENFDGLGHAGVDYGKLGTPMARVSEGVRE